MSKHKQPKYEKPEKMDMVNQCRSYMSKMKKLKYKKREKLDVKSK